MKTVTRTQDEIVGRIESITAQVEAHSGFDFFGKRRELLVMHLDWEHAQPYAIDGATAEMWGEPAEFAAVEAYLEFAVEKIRGERGLSASRSVDAFNEFLWLYTDDATVETYLETDYEPYGRPQIAYAARQLGLGEQFDKLIGD